MSAVPKLRFSECEGKWTEYELKDISEIRTGPFGSVLHKEDYVQVGTPIITVEHLSDDGVVHRNLPLVSDSDKARLKSYHLETGDLVFSRVGSVDRNSLISTKEDGWLFSGRLLRIRPKRKLVNSSFLCLSLQQSHTKHRIRSVAVGQTMPSLNTAILNTFKVQIPSSVPEQKKIADFLGAVDDKIAGLRERERLLTQYKKGVMQKIFTQTLRFKADDGSDFPDWEYNTIGGIYDWVKTNSLSRANLNYESGEVKNIHYGDIHTKFSKNFKQEEEDVPFITSSSKADFLDAEFCQLGDVIFADASEDYDDIGKAIEVVKLGKFPLVAGLHTYIARPKQRAVALGFSAYLFQSWELRYEIMRIAQGISVLGISKTNIEQIKFQLPHPDEQQKIADFLSAIDAKITAVSDQITQMQDFKKGLLQQMFV